MTKDFDNCDLRNSETAAQAKYRDTEFAAEEWEPDVFADTGLNAMSADAEDVEAPSFYDQEVGAEFEDSVEFADEVGALGVDTEDAEATAVSADAEDVEVNAVSADEEDVDFSAVSADAEDLERALPNTEAHAAVFADSHRNRYEETVESEHDAYEEYAAEVAPYAPPRALIQPEEDVPETAVRTSDRDRSRAGTGSLIGWIALILAAASLFVWPVVLGPTAAVVGLIAYARGSKALGVWSIIIGLVAFIAYLAIVPYYT